MPKSYNSDLFTLIKNMEPSEKRYFKLFAEGNSTKKNKYVLLFEAIEKQKKFDEKLLLKASFITQLPQLKSRLYDLVLRSLSNYHFGKTIENELRNEADYIDVLINKKLFMQAEKLVRRAIQKSKQYEQSWYTTYFLMRETELTYYTNFENEDEENIKESFKHLYIEMEAFKNKIQYKEAKNNFQRIYLKRKGEVMSRLNTLMNTALLKKQSNAQTPFSEEIFLNINSLYADLNGDIKTAYEHNARLISLMEKRKILIDENPLSYAKYVQNDIGYKMELKQYDNLFISLQKIRNLTFKSLADHVHINAMLNNMELVVYGALGNYNTPYKLLNEHEIFLDKNDNLVHRETLLIFYLNAAIISFYNKNYTLSNKYLNKIINNSSLDNVRIDIHCMVRIIKLLVYYEMQKQDLLDYSIKSAYRYLTKWQHLSPTYKTLLVFLKNKVGKIKTKKEETAAFIALKKELEVAEKQDAQSQTGFNIITWLESKILRKDFVDVVIEKKNQ